MTAAVDYYPTPLPLARAITGAVAEYLTFDDLPDPAKVLEPACGDGNFLVAVHEMWDDTWSMGVELDENLARVARDRAPYVVTHDTFSLPLAKDFDLVIGNPPYSRADEFLRLAIDHVKPGGVVAFLLRAGFLSSKARYEELWPEFSKYEMHVMFVPVRPGFDGKGTDSNDYVLLIVRKAWGPHTFGWLDNTWCDNRNDAVTEKIVVGGWKRLSDYA